MMTAELRGSKADIRIVTYIGEYEQSSSQTVRSVVDSMIAGGATEAYVYINSRGGDPFEATEIVNELMRFGVDNVDLEIGSLAASAATYPTTKFRTKARRNSQIMIHKPMGFFSGNLTQMKAKVKSLENVTEDYQGSYASKTGMTNDQIEDLWKDGDYWMTAEEAHKLGFIDEVIDEDVEITEDDVTAFAACGAPNIPEATKKNETTNSNSHKMDREKLIAALGLDADATDDQIQAAAKEAKKDADRYKAAQQSDADNLQAKAETLVSQAITDKKLTADVKAHWVKMAVADYDSTEAAIQAMQPVEKVSAQLKGSESDDAIKARQDWALEDYLDKAPDDLKAMEKSDPERWKRLNDQYFAKQG